MLSGYRGSIRRLQGIPGHVLIGEPCTSWFPDIYRSMPTPLPLVRSIVGDLLLIRRRGLGILNQSLQLQLVSNLESVVGQDSSIHSAGMEWLDALVIAVAGLLALAHILRQIQKWKALKLKLPPGPPGWPIVGNMLLFGGPFPPQELRKLAHRYGPVMSLRMGSKLVLIISSGEAAREVLKVQDENFAHRPRQAAVDSFTFLEGSIGFTPCAKRNQFLRKMMLGELLVPKKVRENEGQRKEELSAVVRSILGESRDCKEVDVHVKCTSVTLNIMTQVLMSKRFCSFQGQEPDPDATEFMDVVHEANKVLAIKMFGDYIPSLAFLDDLVHQKRIQRCKNRLSKFFDGPIAEHRQRRKGTGAAPARGDFMDALLDLPDEPGVSKDNVIKGFVGDLLFAGVDTPALTAEWAMAEMLKNPACLRKAQAELDAVVGRERLLEEDDIASLPYIQAAMKETLRVHPVTPLLLPHQSDLACQVNGFDIPARTTVLVNLWAIHRAPSAHVNPDQFDPDRFFGREVDTKGLKSLDLIPFGAGRRMCPAANFGLSLTTFLLATLLHSFDWALPNGQKPDDLDMSEQFGLSVAKKHHLLAVASPRLPLNLY